MASTLTAVVVLVAFGSLSLVTARPTASHQQGVSEQRYYTFFPQQQASKDVEEQADAVPVDQIVDAYNAYVKQRLQRISTSFPQQQSTEKQGSTTWSWAKQQAPQFAKEEGLTFTYPKSWYNQQAKGQQRITYDLDLPFVAKKEGITFTYPQNEQSSSANEEGLPQMQGIRIPGGFGNEQGFTISYPQAQRSYGAEEQGFTVRLPQMQGIRIPGGFGNEQGFTISYPQAQRSYGAKEQGITVRLPQMQGIRIPGGFGSKQDITLKSAIDFIGAFCSAANTGKLADTLGDLMKQYGSKLCDDMETITEE